MPTAGNRRGHLESCMDALRSTVLSAMACLALMIPGCANGDPAGTIRPDTTAVPPKALYEDVTSTLLPSGVLTGLSMDAGVGDGDLDVVVVSEDDRVNELHLNDGSGRFADEGHRVPVEGTTNGVVVADLRATASRTFCLRTTGRMRFWRTTAQATSYPPGILADSSTDGNSTIAKSSRNPDDGPALRLQLPTT